MCYRYYAISLTAHTFNRIWVDCVIGINSSRKPYTWQLQEGGFKPLFQGFFAFHLIRKDVLGTRLGKLHALFFVLFLEDSH